MADNSWRMGFHIVPPTGWLNDPNGLCQFREIYHAFFQYSPDWPRGGERCWGHATSTDLVSWRYHGIALHQDIPEDANGAYSGSAFIERSQAADGGDRLRLYYTGNVKLAGDHDYILSGREANEITVTSDDGLAFSPKRVLLRNDDYPPFCSCHVRDPKVWEQDGTRRMALGARDRDGNGLALIFDSDDGISWRHRNSIRPRNHFGFMWECPDVIRLDEREFLGICPQGMPAKDADGMGTSWSGYIPLSAPAIETVEADESAYVEWDGGFDFYAPQTFVDDQGRTILIAWVGMPEDDFKGQPKELDWIHCLSIPREVSVDPADPTHLMQWPVSEVEGLRRDEVSLHGNGSDVTRGEMGVACHQADIVVEGIEGGLTLTLDDSLEIACEDEELRLTFLDASGAGRGTRAMPLDEASGLRVLVDNSVVEVFANNGRTCMTSRWFPASEELTASLSGKFALARAWRMADGMVYES
ncbi:MAG: glycoside hydrolase family 32 protein [Olsenella sp.]|nr:glycoside hydrolase family 32 protein [Olsenella sp.]